MTHTPTPWAISKTRLASTRHNIYVTDPLTEKSVVARVTEFEDGEDIANAKFIVKAVNAHDELVETLERMTSFMALHTGDGCQGNEGAIANRWSEPDPERAMAVFEKDVNDARAVLKNAK